MERPSRPATNVLGLRPLAGSPVWGIRFRPLRGLHGHLLQVIAAVGLVAPIFRRETGLLLEQAGRVVAALEAELVGNRLDGQSGATEQLLRFADAEFKLVFMPLSCRHQHP